MPQPNPPPQPPPHVVLGRETLRAILAGMAMEGMLARGAIGGEDLIVNAVQKADHLLKGLGE